MAWAITTITRGVFAFTWKRGKHYHALWGDGERIQFRSSEAAAATDEDDEERGDNQRQRSVMRNLRFFCCFCRGVSTIGQSESRDKSNRR